MAFKPQPDQWYYIIPKLNPGKVLGAPNGNIPMHIEVQTQSKNSGHQQFRFDYNGSNGWWFLTPPYKERFLAVNNSSQADRESIIQWQWEPRKRNLQFQFVPAGNGYYRIMALHSRKYFEIVDLSTAEKGRLVQNSANNNDGQFFSLTPVPNVPSDTPAIAFDQKSDFIRNGALSVLGKVPEVGAGLAFVVGIFWKSNDHFADLWQQMKTYIDIRVRALIVEDKLKEMQNKLSGILESIDQISKSDDNKAVRLEAKIDSIVDIEPSFKDMATTALPYWVALGNIQLALRRTMFTDYDSLFPPKTVEVKGLLKTKPQKKTELTNAIKKYTDVFDDAVDELVKKRVAMITRVEKEELVRPQNPYALRCVKVTDAFDGWGITLWNYDDADNTGHRNYVEWGEFAYNQRKAYIETQYRTEMTDLGKAAQLWGYFADITPLPAEAVYKRTLGVFGGFDGKTAFNGVDDSAITKIEVYSEGDRLCGLQIWYNSASAGVHGKKGNKTDTLTLQDAGNENGETITSIYGYYYESMEGIWFATNKGQLVGAGRERGGFFTADLADGYKASLEKISGKYDDNSVQQLSFHWKYKEIPRASVS